MSGASRPFAAVRFAPPTDHLEDVLPFYEEGLGLRRIDSFDDHAGYMTDRDEIAAIETRMRALGHEPVEPENPYWNDDLTFEDPDGWRVVLRYVDS